MDRKTKYLGWARKIAGNQEFKPGLSHISKKLEFAAELHLGAQVLLVGHINIPISNFTNWVRVHANFKIFYMALP